MSRIGNSPVIIPEGTSVSIEGTVVSVKGKLGELSQQVDGRIDVAVNENQVLFS